MTLRTVLFWLAAACCVVAELAILRSLLFGRAAAAARSGNRPSTTSPRSGAIEIAWALLPAIGLLLVLYLTWRAVDAPPVPTADSSRGAAAIGV